jgi:putative glutamine amidotransferase|tara:strand:+ start:2555 stop:3214 length:660 start_codon:yes stop_codon:yes gene_type:complete
MPVNNKLRIGITMRIVNAGSYIETRDAIAHDWLLFFNQVFPDSKWMPIPNMGEQVINYLRGWDLNCIIISGGNDLGCEPVRDTTEMCLLDHAIKNSIPVFGVCRGLQLLQKYFGGEIERCPVDIHVAETHKVDINGDILPIKPVKESITVNSYHEWGIKEGALSKELDAFAISEDSYVEGVIGKNHRILAVQWHPERNDSVNDFDRKLIDNVIGKWVLV